MASSTGTTSRNIGQFWRRFKEAQTGACWPAAARAFSSEG